MRYHINVVAAVIQFTGHLSGHRRNHPGCREVVLRAPFSPQRRIHRDERSRKFLSASCRRLPPTCQTCPRPFRGGCTAGLIAAQNLGQARHTRQQPRFDRSQYKQAPMAARATLGWVAVMIIRSGGSRPTRNDGPEPKAALMFCFVIRTKLTVSTAESLRRSRHSKYRHGFWISATSQPTLLRPWICPRESFQAIATTGIACLSRNVNVSRTYRGGCEKACQSSGDQISGPDSSDEERGPGECQCDPGTAVDEHGLAVLHWRSS